ncbi:equilibrative nucleotide transporter 1-like [Nicotiana tomentosiformis]|uniref:equilibrative nucleotide transporter 1-like n=1 Tax=Nicotiana tomentosiformis TaxID=4098 RepID=UPI00051B97F0|nr:equilibrative nucleotide transporter 1-like [Nicotiana tomentosiformis]
MGSVSKDEDSESTTTLLIPSSDPNNIPKDSFHIAYVIYFFLGSGYVLPRNVFITAVDYFTFLYPTVSVDRIFAIVNMTLSLVCLLFIVGFANKSSCFVRINVGMFLYVVALVMVPLMDFWYVKGRVGVYGGFYVTVGLVGLTGAANGLVQGGVIGSAGELPDRYIQATLAGTAASGVLVSLLRILTKAIYPQDADGLRKSANLYFIVSIAMMILCTILYNVAYRLPVIKYYTDLKTRTVLNEEKEEKGGLTRGLWRSTLWDIVGTVKWYGFGILSIYVVTLCIFPGYITEDVHSQLLRDWYPILLITGYNVFDLVGKSLTSICLLGNAKVAIFACYSRLLFLPLFYCCLHGPKFFRTELPVTILTCLLGLTNGYLTSVLMMLGSKTVRLQHAEVAGSVLVLFLILGLTIGSVISWLWAI